MLWKHHPYNALWKQPFDIISKLEICMDEKMNRSDIKRFVYNYCDD